MLIDKAGQILSRDVSPQFIVIELLAFMQEKKIMRPAYSALQLIVRTALNTERNRVRVILHESLTEVDKTSLKTIVFDNLDCII
ncbi:DUF4158 domain-containing protein [Legionella gratiana]|nr:DUF4158 domain-containing protein [Legionella gratiana]